MTDTESRSPNPVPRASAKGSGRVGYVMAMAAGGLVVWGVMVHGQESERPAVEPVQVVAAPVPASAYACSVRCPGYVEPDDSYHAAPSFLFEKPVVPTSGVVTVVVPAPVQVTQPTATKTSKAAQPRQTRQSQSKAPKQAAQKQSQPSTTTTVTQKTSTTSKGTTTTSTTTKTTTKG